MTKVWKRRQSQIDDVLKPTYSEVSRKSDEDEIKTHELLSRLDYHPSKQSLPFLPKSPKCLKPGQLAKVIAKTGRVVVGRIRYCGPVASIDVDETFVGLQLPNALGDCDGSMDGTKFFEW